MTRGKSLSRQSTMWLDEPTMNDQRPAGHRSASESLRGAEAREPFGRGGPRGDEVSDRSKGHATGYASLPAAKGCGPILPARYSSGLRIPGIIRSTIGLWLRTAPSARTCAEAIYCVQGTRGCARRALRASGIFLRLETKMPHGFRRVGKLSDARPGLLVVGDDKFIDAG
jgi:hypothetical protein